MRLFNRFRELSAAERRDLFGAMWRLLMVRLLLALVGIRSSQRFLGPESEPVDIVSAEALEPWHRRALALRRAGARIPGVHCLARALALQGWMKRHGLQARLAIGVRRGPGGIECHAWVTHDTTPLGDTPEQTRTYTELDWETNAPKGVWRK